MNNNISILEKKLGVSFKNKQIILEALTHSSYANENNTVCYERLEFLGDAVLELAMSKYLIDNDHLDEGDMTKKRAQAVCEEALVIYASKINLSEHMLLGKGEEQSGGRRRSAIIADTFESILGAVFVDLGFEEAMKLFGRVVVPFISEVLVIKDYKSMFQELVQADKRSISYQIVSETGPSHDKVFEAVAVMDGIIMGRGTGKSKKDAEQHAACEALKKVAKE